MKRWREIQHGPKPKFKKNQVVWQDGVLVKLTRVKRWPASVTGFLYYFISNRRGHRGMEVCVMGLVMRKLSKAEKG